MCQRRAIVPWHHGQQVLRRIKDKAQHDEVEVDPPMTFWDPAQRRRNGLDSERPKVSSPGLADGQHEGAARDVRGFVRRGELEREMLAPRKGAPCLLVRLHQRETAQRGDVARRTVA